MTAGIALLALGGLVALLARAVAYKNLTLLDLIDAPRVAYIAESLPPGDDFILTAWDFVGREVPYASYGTTIYFSDSAIRCKNCLTLDELMDQPAPVGNCVAKSMLLTSILRNRLGPDQVYMALGDLVTRGETGGHAWVIVKRAGTWYVLEATSPPHMTAPWTTVEAAASRYRPTAYLNDLALTCADPEMCIVVRARRCPCAGLDNQLT